MAAFQSHVLAPIKDTKQLPVFIETPPLDHPGLANVNSNILDLLTVKIIDFELKGSLIKIECEVSTLTNSDLVKSFLTIIKYFFKAKLHAMGHLMGRMLILMVLSCIDKAEVGEGLFSFAVEFIKALKDEDAFHKFLKKFFKIYLLKYINDISLIPVATVQGMLRSGLKWVIEYFSKTTEVVDDISFDIVVVPDNGRVSKEFIHIKFKTHLPYHACHLIRIGASSTKPGIEMSVEIELLPSDPHPCLLALSSKGNDLKATFDCLSIRAYLKNMFNNDEMLTADIITGQFTKSVEALITKLSVQKKIPVFKTCTRKLAPSLQDSILGSIITLPGMSANYIVGNSNWSLVLRDEEGEESINTFMSIKWDGEAKKWQHKPIGVRFIELYKNWLWSNVDIFHAVTGKDLSYENIRDSLLKVVEDYATTLPYPLTGLRGLVNNITRAIISNDRATAQETIDALAKEMDGEDNSNYLELTTRPVQLLNLKEFEKDIGKEGKLGVCLHVLICFQEFITSLLSSIESKQDDLTDTNIRTMLLEIIGENESAFILKCCQDNTPPPHESDARLMANFKLEELKTAVNGKHFIDDVLNLFTCPSCNTCTPLNVVQNLNLESNDPQTLSEMYEREREINENLQRERVVKRHRSNSASSDSDFTVTDSPPRVSKKGKISHIGYRSEEVEY